MKTIKVKYGKLSLIIRNVPDWVEYIATDKDKEMYGYNGRPDLLDEDWDYHCHGCKSTFVGRDEFNLCDWEDSLKEVEDIEF